MQQLEKNSIRQFNRWAKFYDNFLFSRMFHHTNNKIAKLLNPQKNSSLLDIGCGTGILIKKLLNLNMNMKLYGVDITPGMVKMAKNKFKNDKQVNIKLGSSSKLPYPSNTFDYVTCSSSLHHHPDTYQSLKEMTRVLKTGGKLIICDGYVDGFIRKFVDRLENFIFNEGKVFRYTKIQMYRFFLKLGYKKITQQSFSYLALITIGIKP